MEVANERTPVKNAYTKLYSPTHGSVAYAYESAVAPAPKPKPTTRPAQRPAPVAAPRQQVKPRLSAGCRLSVFVSMVLLSATLLFVVFRYSMVAAEYAKVNELQANIEDVQLRIRSLNVNLECAVNIQQIKDKAQSWGMDYPMASQYVHAGDTLHVDGAAATNTANGEPEGTTPPDNSSGD